MPLVSRDLRILTSAAVPANLSAGTVGLWSPSGTGSTQNHPLWRNSDGTDTDLTAFLPLAGGTMTGSGNIINATLVNANGISFLRGTAGVSITQNNSVAEGQHPGPFNIYAARGGPGTTGPGGLGAQFSLYGGDGGNQSGGFAAGAGGLLRLRAGAGGQATDTADGAGGNIYVEGGDNYANVGGGLPGNAYIHGGYNNGGDATLMSNYGQVYLGDLASAINIGSSYGTAPVNILGFSLGRDASHQITLPNSTGTFALTSDLSAYLPLAGGVMGNGSEIDWAGGSNVHIGQTGVQAPTAKFDTISPVVTSGVSLTYPDTAGFLDFGNGSTATVSSANHFRFRSNAGVAQVSNGTAAYSNILLANTAAGGDATGTLGALTLATVNSNVGSFTNASITVDAKGRITAASSGAAGGVTSVAAGTGMSFTTITSTGSVAIDTTVVATTSNTLEMSGKTLTAMVVKTGLTASGSASNNFGGSTGDFAHSTGNLTWVAAAGKTATWSGPTTISPPAAATMATPTLTLTPGAHTANTASTEFSNLVYTAVTSTFATGAIATQRERLYNASTYAFAGASTITDAYAEYSKGPIAGTNATLTNVHVYGAEILAVGTAQTKNGLTLVNTTAATVSAQQYSPGLNFLNKTWETTGGTSQTSGWFVQAQGSNAATATSNLVFYHNSNGTLTKRASMALASTDGIVLGDGGGTSSSLQLSNTLGSKVSYGTHGLFVGSASTTLDGGGTVSFTDGTGTVLLSAGNLTATVFVLRPDGDNTRALGDSTHRWATVDGIAYNSRTTAMSLTTTVATGSARRGFILNDTNAATTDKLLAIQQNGTDKSWFTLTGLNTPHLIGSTSAPTIATTSPVQLGTVGTPTVVITAGTDLAGTLTITTSTVPTAFTGGTEVKVATLTFNTAYSAAPTSVVIVPANGNAAQAQSGTLGIFAYVKQSTTATGTFDVYMIDAGAGTLTASTAYAYAYVVVQ